MLGQLEQIKEKLEQNNEVKKLKIYGKDNKIKFKVYYEHIEETYEYIIKINEEINNIDLYVFMEDKKIPKFAICSFDDLMKNIDDVIEEPDLYEYFEEVY